MTNKQPRNSAPSTPPKIEILSINDNKEASELEACQVTPNERMVVNEVIQIWKFDPLTESLGISKLHGLVKQQKPNWSLSEKRLKTLLKKYGLLFNQPKFYYANQIVSSETPQLELPDFVTLKFVKNKGKGLYATKKIKKDTLLWQESPFIYVPPLGHLNLMRTGKSCAYCGKLLPKNFYQANLMKNLDCKNCDALWCSKLCQKLDILHGILNHNKKINNSRIINCGNFQKYADFCLENNWQAAFAVAMIHIHCIIDSKKFEQFQAFAQISQEIRYKAIDATNGAFDSSDGGALFVKEQQELLWKSGFENFNAIFDLPSSTSDADLYKLTYDQYLTYMGTYNINNIDSLYLIQSHLNHNCTKNVNVIPATPSTPVSSGSNDLSHGIKVYAARDIKPNEELVTSYVNPAHPVFQRKRELRVNWGFNCLCDRCKTEEKQDEKEKQKQTQSPSEEIKNTSSPCNSSTDANTAAIPSTPELLLSNSNVTLSAESNTEKVSLSHTPASADLSSKGHLRSSFRKSNDFDSLLLTQDQIRDMIKNDTTLEEQAGFEISNNGENGIRPRRKSVRFDEKVVAVSSET